MSRPDEEQRRRLTEPEVRAAGLADWRNLRGILHARFATGDFATGLALVARFGEAAERADHHPDLLLTYPGLVVKLHSHDVGGLTSRDVDLARTFSDLAAEAGVRADSAGLGSVELGLDAAVGDRLVGFWSAVLGAPVRDGEVNDDARGLVPNVWFQDPDPSYRPAPEEPEQRWHPDVWVDPQDAEARVEAALAAGGSLVSDAEAPSYWVLADPDGNRVCVCTPQDRDRPA